MYMKRVMSLVVSQSTRPTVMVRRSIRSAEDGGSYPSIYHIAIMTPDNVRYAIERTPSFINVFFWSRQSASIPSDVLNPGLTIDTDNWVWIECVRPGADHALRFFFFGTVGNSYGKLSEQRRV